MLAEASANLADVWQCASENHCAVVRGADSGFGLALMVTIALLGAGAWLSVATAGVLLDSAHLAPKQWPRAVVVAAGAGVLAVWVVLAFAYAVPQFTHVENYLGWMLAVPLYTCLLVAGLLLLAAVAALVVASVRDPELLQPKAWWERLLLSAAITGVLVAWHYVYEKNPDIAAGPFHRGPDWLQNAADTWCLRVPVSALWTLATFLATPTGIAIFVVCSLASLLLRAVGGTTGLFERGVSSAVTVVAAVVGATVTSLVVGLVGLAIAAFALMALIAYFLYYAMLAFVASMMISWLLKD